MCSELCSCSRSVVNLVMSEVWRWRSAYQTQHPLSGGELTLHLVLGFLMEGYGNTKVLADAYSTCMTRGSCMAAAADRDANIDLATELLVICVNIRI